MRSRYDLPMVVVSVMYPKTAESYFDLRYYLDKHIPLVKARLNEMGLRSIHVLRGATALDGGSPAFELIAQLTFDSTQQVQEGLVKHGQEIMTDIPKFTNVQPLIQMNEPANTISE